MKDYASGDYATTYSDWTDANNHMFMAAGALSGAIVQQFPNNLS